MSLFPPALVRRLLYSGMALTQLIRGTWDVIRRAAELPKRSSFKLPILPMINLAFQWFFFCLFVFFRELQPFQTRDKCEGGKKKRSDVSNLHKFTLSGRRGGAGWTRWPHGLPTHVTVKINGRHQRQLPPQETFHIHLYCACVDQWRATTL